MNDTQALNSRQSQLLELLSTHPKSSRSELEQLLANLDTKPPSRITIIRDLNYLVKSGWVAQTGGGKYIKYSINPSQELRTPINLQDYFATSADVRIPEHKSYDPKNITSLNNIFTQEELGIFEQGRNKLQAKFDTLNSTILRRELERFTIDLSWKSSQIEGNTYSLLETEELIKNRNEAKGHKESEAVMILNHKKAFDTVLEEKSTFKNIVLSDIRAIHSVLTQDLNIKQGIREFGVGITGTNYLPLDNKWQLAEALQQLSAQLSATKSVPEQSFILLIMIAYIQPFSDGNKRTSRITSNAILLANDYYPLSYRSIDEVEYKKALVIFYETGNIYHLKRIFLEQYQFAVNTYFL